MRGGPAGLDQDRRIPVPGLFNLRDLGGYPAAGNRVTRWRTLLRSDAPHLVRAAGTAMLAGYGLATVIDLRTQAEIDRAPSALTGLGARSRHICLLGDDLEASPPALGGIYRHLVDQRGPAIAEVVIELARPGGLPALVHCAAGKDRTGIVTALILAVVGVPDAVIAADYALTARYLNDGNGSALRQLRGSVGVSDRLTPELLASPAALVADMLTRVRARHGSVDGYFTGLGVRPAVLDAVRAALTQPPGICDQRPGGGRITGMGRASRGGRER